MSLDRAALVLLVEDRYFGNVAAGRIEAAEAAVALRTVPWSAKEHLVVQLAELANPKDRYELEAVGLAEELGDDARHGVAGKEDTADTSGLCPPRCSVIETDRFYFEILLSNLIDNACKYAPQGNIGITLVKRDSGATLSIADEGSGIPQKDIGGIFNKFYRRI